MNGMVCLAETCISGADILIIMACILVIAVLLWKG